jgi:RNA polymerase-binding transcription factor DksA
VTDSAPTPHHVDDVATDAADAAVTTSSSPGDGVEAAMATIEEAEGLLGDVEAALERLEAGQYRTCEICGAPLDSAILVSAPTLRRCVVHAS